MAKRMRAAVLHEVGSPLVLEEVELHGPSRDELLVRVAACGVCHSDWHMIKGEWAGFSPPIIVGHEGAGVVEQVGEGVTGVQPGDHVVLGWKTSCGQCRYCRDGRPYLCESSPTLSADSAIMMGDRRINRHFANGYFAEYAIGHRSTAIPIRKDVPLDRAALLACAVMTGVGAAINTARVCPGSSVAVFGCGGVGVNVIQGAALCGALRIIGVDLADGKLEYARRFGMTDGVNAAVDNPLQAIQALTGGRGVDFAFEASGSMKAMQQAFAALGRGGKAIIAGIPAFRESAELALPIMPFYGDRWVTGAYYGGANLWRDIPVLVDLYRLGKLNLDDQITRRYTLDQINEAFADLATGKPGRGVIVFP
jgi:S-(hydroxymethyl)glutathione dehydrogenase/alcohol dehydrogenase